MLSRQASSRSTQAVPVGLVKCVGDLAVDVELELPGGGVADPHRLRALVAREPVELELGQPPLAGQAVHDLEVARAGPPRRGAAIAAIRAPRRDSRR